MIDQLTIQKIFDAANIHDIVSDFVSLRKRGVNYIGSCPFHNEKTGSFTVSPSKGIYKCFGCGKGGNAVNFIMDHEQMSYVEALKWIAARYGIHIEEKELSDSQKQEKSERESMLVVTNYAHNFFIEQLNKTDEGKSIGLSYFKHRGLEQNTIDKFGLGYSPENWESFTKSALEKGYNKDYLVKTGLCIETQKGIFDRFRARVIFPIRNIAGKVIAFGGRIMTNDPKSAKYLNSPESEIYHKSNTLYGIYYAKKSIVQQDRCYMVEGYLDVISFHQKGIENTVASSGTALTNEQIRLIKRLSNNITIIYDGDAAGLKASLRGIDLVLEEGLNVKIIPLPEGEDPDSFAQSRTKEALIEYINNNEVDFIHFKTKLLLKEAGEDPIQRAKLIASILKSISLIPDKIIRAVYIQETAVLLKMDESLLHTEIAKLRNDPAINIIGANLKKQNKSTKNVELSKPKIENKFPTDTEELAIIRYLLTYGESLLYEITDETAPKATTTSIKVGEYIISELETDELTLFNENFNEILTLYKDNYQQENINITKFLINHHKQSISSVVADILSEPYELSTMWSKKGGTAPNEEKALFDLLPKVINNYKIKRLEILCKQADNKILECQNNNDHEQLFEWIKKKNTIIQVRAQLNNTLKRTV